MSYLDDDILIDEFDQEVAVDPLHKIKKYEPRIRITELTPLSMSFVLTHSDLSFANSLRRVMIAEVATLAFDFIDIKENSSVLDDEFLSHRIGLLPLRTLNGGDLSGFRYSRDCDCEDISGCSSCAVRFELNVYNDTDEVMHVTHRHLRNMCEVDEESLSGATHREIMQAKACAAVRAVSDGDVIRAAGETRRAEVKLREMGFVGPARVSDDIIIAKLKKDQCISFEAIGRKGIGKDHAKFQPISGVAMKPEPVVRLNSEAVTKLNTKQQQKMKDVCPRKVFDIEAAALAVKRPMDCMFCGECTRVAVETFDMPSLIRVTDKPETFHFTFETHGSMAPESVLRNALQVLDEKLDTLKRETVELIR